MPVGNSGLIFIDGRMLGRNSDYVFIDNVTTKYTLGELPETTFEITVEGNLDMKGVKEKFMKAFYKGESFYPEGARCYGKFNSSLQDQKNNFFKKIYINEKKNTVVVVFNRYFKIHNKNTESEDDYITTNKIVVKCNKEETFDVYRAVSAACMIKDYGSNSAFKSHIRKIMGVYSDSLYDMIARYLTGAIFGRWEEFVKAVDEAVENSEGR